MDKVIFAGIHLHDRDEEIISVEEIDFEKDVIWLKEVIAKKVEYKAENLELVHLGNLLQNEEVLSAAEIKPLSTIHCFTKKEEEKPYKPADNIDELAKKAEKLFGVIANCQISVNSRVAILQKVVNEYPEFRRNLGAQAMIRDSVLFNQLHKHDVMENVKKTYPIICEAAEFIVDTVKKELIKCSGSSFEADATSNTSSEEESIGSSNNDTPSTSRQSEDSRIRQISRQQLAFALARIGEGSVNSLSNIAQRNSEQEPETELPTAPSTSSASTSAVTPLSTSESGERISSAMFRSGLQRALDLLGSSASGPSTSSSALNLPELVSGLGASSSASNVPNLSEPMDTTEVGEGDFAAGMNVDDESDVIPAAYRSHPYIEQLRTMVQMGFTNFEENVTYLNITNGSIEAAVNLVMSSFN